MGKDDRRSEINKDNAWARFVATHELKQDTEPVIPKNVSMAQYLALRNARRPYVRHK
jgi:hypothetical protein